MDFGRSKSCLGAYKIERWVPRTVKFCMDVNNTLVYQPYKFQNFGLIFQNF